MTMSISVTLPDPSITVGFLTAVLGWGLARTTPRRDRMYHAAIAATPSET
jgi:hypothetical protein